MADLVRKNVEAVITDLIALKKRKYFTKEEI
jgi:hypothetical protein